LNKKESKIKILIRTEINELQKLLSDYDKIHEFYIRIYNLNKLNDLTVGIDTYVDYFTNLKHLNESFYTKIFSYLDDIISFSKNFTSSMVYHSINIGTNNQSYC
jgi:hypothetical protein